MFGCVRTQVRQARFSFAFLPIDVECIPAKVFRDDCSVVSLFLSRSQWIVCNKAVELIIDKGGLSYVDSHLAASLVVPPRRFQFQGDVALFMSSLTEYKARE